MVEPLTGVKNHDKITVAIDEPEVLPQAVFNKRLAEATFYETFFSSVTHWATNLHDVTEIALREASTNGIEAMDALHVAAAASIGASELITTEKASRSIHRARVVKVVTLHPDTQR